MIRCTILLFAGLLALAVSTARAAPPTAASHPPATPLEHLPALKGDYFPLTDPGSGRVHHVYVRYPEGYDPAADVRYPTVYLTDGDSLFPILAANHLFLTYDDGLPEARGQKYVLPAGAFLSLKDGRITHDGTTMPSDH